MPQPGSGSPSALTTRLARSGLAGFATLSLDGEVLTREGVLSAWLPGVGRSCFESPILSGLDEDLADLRQAGDPLVLPGIRLAVGGSNPRCDILIARPAESEELTVLTTIDHADRPIDHWVLQQKREQRLLEERVVVASRELERINENLRQFTSVAAHDLQAPLRQISAFAGLLRGAVGLEASADAREYIETIEGCAGRLHRMISGLLASARLRADQAVFEPVELTQIVAEAVLNLAVPIRETGALVQVGPLPEVEGSPSLLVNLFQNLIANSLRHCAATPPWIEIAMAGDRVVAVTDNGVGIAPEHAETVFGSFVRLDPGRCPEGVGLGLSTARRIAELHRWRLYLDVGHRSGGARFCLDLDGAGQERRTGPS